MVGKTKHRTVDDSARLDSFAEIGCLPCLLEGWESEPTVQHVTDCGRRMKDQHQCTYPSCPWHHQGIIDASDGYTVERATLLYGPSLKHDKRAFEERYGRERELIRITDVLFQAYFNARRRGRYLSSEEYGRIARRQQRMLRGVAQGTLRQGVGG